MPALVLCPPALIKTWEKALEKFGQGFLKSGDVKTLSAKGSSKGKSKLPSTHSPKVFIVPYTMLAKVTADNIITPHQFGIVIADESHNLKEKESQRTIRALPYLKQATVTVALTGTPEVNRPVELFTQVHGIRPDIFDDYQGFVKRYCDAKEGRHGEQDVKGSSNETELKNILNHTVMIRRLKSDVLHDLASKCREIRKIPADPKYLDDYKALDRKYQLVLDKLSRRGGGGFQKDLEGEKSMLQTQQYLQTGLCKVKEVVHELELLVTAARKFSDASLTSHSDETSVINHKNDVISTLECDDFIQSPRIMETSTIDLIGESVPVVLLESSDDDDTRASKGQFNECEELVNSSSDESCGRVKGSSGRKKRLQSRSTRSGSAPKRRLRRGCVEIAEDCDSDCLSMTDYVHVDRNLSRKSMSDTDNSSTWSDDGDELFFGERALPKTKMKKEKGKKTSRGKSSVNVDIDTSLVTSSDDEGSAKKAWKDLFGNKRKAPTKSRHTGGGVDDVAGVYNRGSKTNCGLIHKIVVFAHHKRVMDSLEESLRKLKVSYCRVDGETAQSKRTQLLDDFQDGDIYDVALLSITACGTGLTLTRANVALFAELAWSCGTISQAEDRIHRIGQIAESVRIIYMICDDTADRYMWPKIQEKFKNIGNTIGMKDSSLGATEHKSKQGMSLSKGAHSSGPKAFGSQAQQSLMDSYISASQVYGSRTAPSKSSSAAGKLSTTINVPKTHDDAPPRLSNSTPVQSLPHDTNTGNCVPSAYASGSTASNESSLHHHIPQVNPPLTGDSESKLSSNGISPGKSIPSTTSAYPPSLPTSTNSPATIARNARIAENKLKAQMRLQHRRIAQQQMTTLKSTAMLEGNAPPQIKNINSTQISVSENNVKGTQPPDFNCVHFTTGGGIPITVSDEIMGKISIDKRYSSEPNVYNCATAVTGASVSSTRGGIDIISSAVRNAAPQRPRCNEISPGFPSNVHKVDIQQGRDGNQHDKLSSTCGNRMGDVVAKTTKRSID